jgi:hypothetical protein
VRRSEAEAMIERSDMPQADRHVFLTIVRRANNDDCVIPPQFTLGLDGISTKTGLHMSTVARSLAHLELHRWIQRERSTGGRKRKDGSNHRTRYLIIACGTPLPCDCPKPSRRARVSGSKQSHRANGNSRVGTVSAAGQTRSRTEGLSEGGEVEGKLADCDVCGTPMDPVLPASGFGTHPCCDPAEVSPLSLPVVDLAAAA